MPPGYPIPAILLARLAVDRKEQGRGLGAALLKDAFYRIASAAEIVGARAVLVHANDSEAKSFYERFNFDEFHPTRSARLILAHPMNTDERLITALLPTNPPGPSESRALELEVNELRAAIVKDQEE